MATAVYYKMETLHLNEYFCCGLYINGVNERVPFTAILLVKGTIIPQIIRLGPNWATIFYGL